MATVAPTVTIDPIPTLGSGARSTLSASLVGGTYDNVIYTWTMTTGDVEYPRGSLSMSNQQSAIWTRPYPPVGVTRTFTILLTVQVSLTGSNTILIEKRATTTVFGLRNPVIGGGAFAISQIPVGQVGTDVEITASPFDEHSRYDTVRYRWSVNGGTLSSTSKATVTWTRPDTPGFYTITLRVTVNGAGINAAQLYTNIPSQTYERSIAVSSAPSETVDISSSTFIDFGNSKAIAFGSFPQLEGPYVPSDSPRFLRSVSITSTIVQIDIDGTASGGTLASRDLTSEFESYGRFVFTIGGTEYVIPMRGRDTAEPYRLTQPAGTISALFDAFDGTGTLDFVLPRMNIVLGTSQYARVLHGGKVYDKLVYNGKTY